VDRKQEVGAEVPQLTVPAAARDEVRTAPVNRWLVGAVIVLAAGVIALGVALIVQSGNEPTPTPASTPMKIGLAHDETVEIIDAMNEASAWVDGKHFASFFTSNGVLEEPNIDEVTRGRQAIAQYLKLLHMDTGFELQGFSPVVQTGNLVAQGTIVTTVHGSSGAIAVYELTRDGKISHMWLIAAN
jgi:hypothetical protein